ncbi:hypothetical protein Tsubulata_043619 [Turnera subulata]|uniref:Uncharacterized protein n=1 Tax=Turnera subulata TaxID=218843 RepID=A0A9Q0F6V3_9ROSI|nr:hypothetical protein Tsubulata_043619 [Turnera subulata]
MTCPGGGDGCWWCRWDGVHRRSAFLSSGSAAVKRRRRLRAFPERGFVLHASSPSSSSTATAAARRSCVRSSSPAGIRRGSGSIYFSVKEMMLRASRAQMMIHFNGFSILCLEKC